MLSVKKVFEGRLKNLRVITNHLIDDADDVDETNEGSDIIALVALLRKSFLIQMK